MSDDAPSTASTSAAPARPSTGRRPRLSRALAPRATRTQAVIGALFVLLGLLLVAAVRGNSEDTFLAIARSEDLVRVLDDLGARQARLEAEARRLEVARDRLQEGSSGQAVEEIRRRADGLAILAGTVPATGPGVVVTLRDPAGSAVDGALLLDTVQELRDAGAEAIQIGDQRVIVSTWFGEERGEVVVSGVPVATPVVVRAIGDPDTLATALEIPGGIADTVRTAGGDIDVATSDAVDVTATVPAPEPE